MNGYPDVRLRRGVACQAKTMGLSTSVAPSDAVTVIEVASGPRVVADEKNSVGEAVGLRAPNVYSKLALGLELVAVTVTVAACRAGVAYTTLTEATNLP